MFKNVEEAKAFILWAKSQQLKRVKVDQLEVEFLPSVVLESMTNEVELVDSITGLSSIKASQDEADDEELLYWSANGKT